MKTRGSGRFVLLAFETEHARLGFHLGPGLSLCVHVSAWTELSRFALWSEGRAACRAAV